MYKVAMQYKIIDCYIRHGLSSPELVLLLEGGGDNEGGGDGVNEGIKGTSRSSGLSETQPNARKAAQTSTSQPNTSRSEDGLEDEVMDYEASDSSGDVGDEDGEDLEV
ncbi:unnamed protein product, partial [Cuscuta epithymum]